MANLLYLRKHAEISTKNRKHIIEWQPAWHSESKSIQTGICKLCGREVQINTKPLPNEIDIGGEALALNCSNI